jgi:hypothetical protein
MEKLRGLRQSFKGRTRRKAQAAGEVTATTRG